MTARESAEQRKPSRPEEVESENAPAPAQNNEALDADVDAILEEIDGVLEENAEDFVKSFVQKGGQ
jgi:ubiquitin-like protein Pup